ncbi:MAG: DoxX family protein [Novosphingobium sp.]
MPAIRVPALVRLALTLALTLLLSAFHAFVGWHKTFSSREELIKHTAWTVHLPDWLGKLVGVIEMGLVAAMLVALLRPRFSRVGQLACYGFIVLELVSTATHQITQDGASLSQNLVSILLTAALAWLFAERARATI